MPPALTNLIGNGVATVAISLSEGELDKDKLHEAMAHPIKLGEELEHVRSRRRLNHCAKNHDGPWIDRIRPRSHRD